VPEDSERNLEAVVFCPDVARRAPDYAPRNLFHPGDRLVDRLLGAYASAATRWTAFAHARSHENLVVPRIAREYTVSSSATRRAFARAAGKRRRGSKQPETVQLGRLAVERHRRLAARSPVDQADQPIREIGPA
jgi:AraC-like DNA-binding protein